MIRTLLGLIVIVLAGYTIITENYEIQPYIQVLLGALMLVIGFSELKKGGKTRKWYGIISIAVSIFLFYVSIQTFLMN
ncbi:DUF3953 domain-containing protein [Terrihalobacillus insolitus]|uniref:DUF3953 domain-containing protein n=1 Tax=Terrihalobacillus insolitus TaxID=2950438 RepID=UPI0023414499|nr:DUF3953 domain-containing protein [Terrihalobacillus insolitus]MDC3414748.1 DUF3953 domain-containing protein [Terrihalobacillus insolitus]